VPPETEPHENFRPEQKPEPHKKLCGSATLVNIRVRVIFSPDFFLIEISIKLNGKSKKLLQFVTFLVIYLC
jgi:hypothetical protein